MRVKKFIFWSLATTAALIVVASAVLYVLASWKPVHYAPARLTQKQKNAAAYRFVNTVITPINNYLGEGRPFSLTLSEEEVNAYLASMDEIYALRPDRPGQSHVGEVYRWMGKNGLADPAVSFRDGVATLMGRSKEYDKIISAGMSFEFISSGKEIRVHSTGIRVGRMPIPDFIVWYFIGDPIERFRKKSGKSGGEAEEPLGGGTGISSEQIGKLLVSVLSAIDGEPLPAEFRFHRWLVVRIERIEIADGRMTLRINPIRRAAEED